MGKTLEHNDSCLSVISFGNEDIPGYADFQQKTAKLALAAAGAISTNPLISPTKHYREHKFVVKINQFSERAGTRAVIKSTKAIIDVGLGQPTKWCLLLYPNGNQEDREGFVSLYLYRWDKQPTPVPATFSFSILNSFSEKSFVVDVTEKKMFGHTPGNSKSLGAPKFVSREDLFDPAWNLLSEDTLTVICELTVYLDQEIEIPLSNTVSFRGIVEESHYLPHPEEANKKKARANNQNVGLFNPMRFLQSMDTWKKPETEV